MKDRIFNQTDIAPFELVDQPEKLLPILKSRLPKSGQLYNTVQMYPKFKTEAKIYILDFNKPDFVTEISPNAWIILIYDRKDVARDMVISVPENVEITEEIKEVFANSKIFNWSESYIFSVVERRVTLLICEISLMLGSNAKLFPCNFYYCPTADSLALDTSHDDDVELKPLDLVTGPDFMYNSWAYAVEGSLEYITQSIERNISSGVYSMKDGKPISGILTTLNGFMGMLYTDKAYRNKSYGKLCMQNLIKELAKNGFVPCSAVEICNVPSMKFHHKIGMKQHGIVDFVRYDGPTAFK